MKEKISKNLKKLCTQINRNPLWHLCRSNTENAISNFWAYLIELTGSAEIILGPKYNKKISKVIREHDHMDIQIYFNGEGTPEIIIENKVKSLASKKQIEDYQKKYRLSKFFLITPNGEKEFKQPNTTWLSYQKIRNNIQKYKLKHKLTGEVYDNFLNLLLQIKEIASLSSECCDYCLLWGENQQPDRDEFIKMLTEEKVYALITKTLVQKYIKKFELKLPNAPFIEIGFSRGTPLFSWKWEYDKNNLCGIQVQNRQLRYFIESKNKKESPNEKILIKWLKECGYKDGIKDSKLHKTNRKFNTFSGFFIYKYYTILKEEKLDKKLNNLIRNVERIKQIKSPFCEKGV